MSTQTNVTDTPLLKGLRVLDLAHHYSGQHAACLLADLGADVVHVEHPGGGPQRQTSPRKNGTSLWWKVLSRGKKNITLKLSDPKGRDMLLQMVSQFDVIIENFRPGTLEKWGLGPAELEAAGANAVMLRISGFGQTGPSRHRIGFGTIAEAFSGLANLTGFPDGPPVFPSVSLADGVAGTFGAFGLMSALYSRKNGSAKGIEVVDMGLFEGLFRLICVQVPNYDQFGTVMTRPGNFLVSHGVLRNLYLTEDNVYYAVSAVGDKVIRRVLAGVGAHDLIKVLETGVLSSNNQEAVDTFLIDSDNYMKTWSASRTYDQVHACLEEADVVFQRVYTAKEIVEDPTYLAREDVISVPDAELGQIRMPGIVPKFPGRTHTVKYAGAAVGAFNSEVFKKYLGLTESDLESLQKEGII